MKVAGELRSNVKNMRHYCKRLRDLVKIQFEDDVSVGHRKGINMGAGTIRFDSLGAISAATIWIEQYIENIEANLKSAEEQDQKLGLLEEPEEQQDNLF
jgi:hypothetical protein